VAEAPAALKARGSIHVEGVKVVEIKTDVLHQGAKVYSSRLRMRSHVLVQVSFLLL